MGIEKSKAEADLAPLITVYYWRRGFMLMAPSFVLQRSTNPYRRLSATLMYASRNSFTLETGENDSVVARAALIAPKVLRRKIVAINSDILICDLAVATPEFNALKPLLGSRDVQVLDDSRLTPLQPDIARAHNGELPPDELPGLINKMVYALTGQHSATPVLHPRVLQALQLIDEFPMRTVSLSWLSKRVHLSPSRLRHLFGEQIGCSLTHYVRWTAVWKGIWLWSRGMPLIDVIAEVGFHDLPHVNRAFNEIFGLNPSALFNPRQVRLYRCVWK